MTLPASLSSFRRALSLLLGVCFLLLCLRFVAALVISSDPWPAVILVLATAAAAIFFPAGSLIGCCLAVPWLNGLSHTGLIHFPAPSSLVFSSIYSGLCLRHVAAWLSPRFKDDASRDTDREFPGILLAIDVLLAAILVSLLVQLCTQADPRTAWNAFLAAPVIGYTDPLYFATSAFVWLQGLFFFRLLLAKTSPGWWLPSAVLSYAACLASFAAIQWLWRLPESYFNLSLSSPFEDIHSFGAVVAAWFVFVLADRGRTPPLSGWIRVALLALFSVLLVFSYSRATWLAAGLFVALSICLRVAWKSRIILVLAGVLLLSVVQFSAGSPVWRESAYLSRLATLLKIESPLDKDPVRKTLYRKALQLIRDRPLLGHGIGSFYQKSVTYTRPDDPANTSRDFAHNFVLQFAAELGFPLTFLLLGVITVALTRGWHASNTVPWAGPCAHAVGCYLLTQLTANALNIYPSNQFLFWFLVAALFNLPTKPCGTTVRSGSSTAVVP